MSNSKALIEEILTAAGTLYKLGLEIHTVGMTKGQLSDLMDGHEYDPREEITIDGPFGCIELVLARSSNKAELKGYH